MFSDAKQAARAYDAAAMVHHGIKAKLNFTDRLITVRQEQAYRLCSPDHYNLTYWQAGLLLGISAPTVCREMKQIKKKCPSLFPLYMPRRGRKPMRYSPENAGVQDFLVKEKF